MDRDKAPAGPLEGRGWPRAAGLFGVTLASAVIQPSVLIAVPLLLLLGLHGTRSLPVFFVAAVALLIVVSGARDGLWYVERAWALLLGGWFLAMTMLVPGWRPTSRALVAVSGSVAATAGFIVLHSGAWAALDWAVVDSVRAGVTTTVDAARSLWLGDVLSADMVAAIYQTAEAQAAVFPALIGIASLAALGVAWWFSVRLSGGGDQALAPLGGFRFNDQLVWVLIAGLVLALARPGVGLGRVGVNLVVFMAALYALRGAGVAMAVSGGVSLVGGSLLAVGFVFAAPIVVGVAVLIGVGDTWLDLRRIVRQTAA